MGNQRSLLLPAFKGGMGLEQRDYPYLDAHADNADTDANRADSNPDTNWANADPADAHSSDPNGQSDEQTRHADLSRESDSLR